MFKFFFFLLFLVWTDWVLNRTRKNVQCDILHCFLHQTNTQAESFSHLCSSNKIHTAWIYTLKEYIIYPPVSFPTMWWASQNQGLISIRDLTECGGCGGGCYETAWTSFLDYRLKQWWVRSMQLYRSCTVCSCLQELNNSLCLSVKPSSFHLWLYHNHSQHV